MSDVQPLRIEATFRVASIPCSSKLAEGVVGDMGNASGMRGVDRSRRSIRHRVREAGGVSAMGRSKA